MTAVQDPCDYVDPGIPSVNHPDRPISPPWRCVREPGHDGAHRKVRVCDRPVVVDGVPRKCVYALGHDGICMPNDWVRYLHTSTLADATRDQLEAALAMSAGEAGRIRRDADARLARIAEHGAKVDMIAAYVLDGVRSPHGNNHTDDCWTRHPHCLAFALIGSGGTDRALGHIRSRSAKAVAS